MNNKNEAYRLNGINFYTKVKAFIKSFYLKPLIISSSCCSLELELVFSQYKLRKTGIKKIRENLSRADILIIAGPMNEKFSILINESIYAAKNKKYIIALGDCTLGNKLLHKNKSLKKLQDLVPVDIFIQGCPPAPQDIINGFKELKLKIRNGYLKKEDKTQVQAVNSLSLNNHLKHNFQIQFMKKDRILEKISILNGFGTRGLENEIIGKKITEILPYIDKIDYTSPFISEILISKYLKRQFSNSIELEAIEIIFLELTRIFSHLLNFARLAKYYKKNSIYNIIFEHQEKMREFLLDFFGSRFNPKFFLEGGIKRNIDGQVLNLVKEIVNPLSSLSKLIDRKILNNFHIKRALWDLGKISKNQAINYSLSGPSLRATGLNVDCRKENDFYQELNFRPVLGFQGSAWDRFSVRLGEIEQSISIIILIIKNYSDHIISKKEYFDKRHKDDYYLDFVDIESPRGKLGFYIKVNDSLITKFQINDPSTNVVKMINEVIFDIPEKLLNPFLISFDIDIVSVDK